MNQAAMACYLKLGDPKFRSDGSKSYDPKSSDAADSHGIRLLGSLPGNALTNSQTCNCFKVTE